MRTLDRNKIKFHYCLHTAKEKIYDEDHNFTGDYTPGYAEPVMIKGNVSASTGITETVQFGNDISYDKTIALQGTDWPIDESTVLIIDTDPYCNEDFVGDGESVKFTLPQTPLRVEDVVVGDGSQTYEYTVNGDDIVFEVAPPDEAPIRVKYLPSIPNYDYTVVRVAISLNHTVLAIKRVEK